MWKPGQLVTIEGRVYRIKKATVNFFICHGECRNKRKSLSFCMLCIEKIKHGCYPELLTSKTPNV